LGFNAQILNVAYRILHVWEALIFAFFFAFDLTSLALLAGLNMATAGKNVSEEGGSGALDVKLHPLVIVNIADHFTRAKVRTDASRVYGALVGVQEGRNVEIFNSFELVATDVDGDLIFDTEFLDRKQKQCSWFLRIGKVAFNA
jgi:hypothetical protein